MSRLVQRVAIVVILLGVLGAGAAWYLQGRNGQVMAYRTAPIKRGDLLISISATGTVEPEEVIDVGAQIAGQIMSFGKDTGGRTVDYGSVVEEGTILAKIRSSPAGRRCSGRKPTWASCGPSSSKPSGTGTGRKSSARPRRWPKPASTPTSRPMRVRWQTSPWARPRFCRPGPAWPRPRPSCGGPGAT